MCITWRSTRSFALVLVLTLAIVVCAAAEEWDGFSSFSTTTSDNPPWQYGHRDTVASTGITLYPVLGFNYAGYTFWSNSANDISQGILGVGTTDLGMHPGPGSAKPVLRWVSPVDGAVTAYAKWYSDGFSPTTDVHIVINGTSVWDALVLPSSPTQEHLATVNVAVGGTIDFVLGNNGEYSSDMTRMIARVSTASAPGTIYGHVYSNMPGHAAVGSVSVIALDSTGVSAGGTSSASDGSYSFTVPAGSYTVTGSKAGYSTASTPVTVSSGESSEADLTLETAIVEGHVRGSEAGAPAISGATVMVDSSLYTTSDADGYYSLHVVPGDVILTCKAVGYSSATQTVSTTSGATSTSDFALDVATSYDCFSDFSTTSNPNGCWEYGWKSSVTGSSIVLYVPPLQTYNEFEYWTYTNVSAGGFVGLDTVHGDSGGYGIGMHPGEGGKKATIRWTSPFSGWATINAAWDRYSAATTDVHVVLNGTEVWSSSIDASTPDATCLTTEELQTGDVLDFVLGDGGNSYGGDCTQCSISIAKAGAMGTISGRVTSTLADNPPVAGASITAGDFSAITADDGTYSIGVPAGTYTVTASKTAHVSASVDNVEVKSDVVTSGVDIVLDTALLSGSVKSTLADDAAIAGAVVTIDDGTRCAISAANGSYSINVLPGSYYIQVLAGGYLSPDGENITFGSGETATRNYSLVLADSSDVSADFTDKANPSGVYTYGYVSSDGFVAYPAPSWECYYMRWWGNGDQNWGNGAIGKNLDYGPATIGGGVVSVPGRQMVMFPYYSPSAIRWTAPTNGLAEVTFSWFDLSSPTNASTSTYIRHNEVDIATGGLDGANDITTSDFGPLQISVTKGDTIDFVQAVAGNTGGNAQNVTGISGTVAWIPSSSVGTIEGTVTSAVDGLPVEGVTITATGSSTQTTTTDADGYYILTLLPDTYTLTTSKHPYLVQTSNAITIAAGEAKKQDFVLVRDESLFGEVTGRAISLIDGAPIMGVVVTADTSETTTTGADGSYELTLFLGAHTLSAAKDGYVDASISITAPAADADIVMVPEAISVTTIAEAKTQMNKNICIIDAKPVTIPTANWTDGSFYIEESDRSCGLKVVGYTGMPALSTDQRVVLTGIMRTDAIGNMYLQLSSVDSQVDGSLLGPVGMTNKAAVESIAQSLLVKIWGNVTAVASDKSYFYVDDGSGIDDGTGSAGIRVDYSNSTVKRLASILVGESVDVTGVVEFANDGSATTKVIKPRSSLDVKNTVVNEVTVTPSDPTWIIQAVENDVTATGSVTFESAPATPLLGGGSALISMGANGVSVINFRTDSQAGVKLADITELSMSNYMTSLDAGDVKGMGFRLSIKLDDVYDSSTGYVDDILTYDPCYSSYLSSISGLGKWVTFDMFNAGRWYSSNGLDGSSDAGPYNTLADYLAVCPDAEIASVSNGGLRVFMGGCSPHWDNVTGYVDNVRIGTKEGTTVYNFEP